MGGLDLKRLESIKIPRVPLLQKCLLYGLLHPNFAFCPGVEIVYDNLPDLTDKPFIFAVNHTDRYNYFPAMYPLYMKGRVVSFWAKGKYYENPILGNILSHLGTLPTVSRGYIIAKDFKRVTGRTPEAGEYRCLREIVENAADESSTSVVPEDIFRSRRIILGYEFDPDRERYRNAVNNLFGKMMELFLALHKESFEKGRDLFIFPEGTRSKTLLRGRPGIGQIALYFKDYPILPIGCSGSDKLYPGASPIAKRGRVVLRCGDPITYEDLSQYAITEEFTPFTPQAEERWGENFQGVADLVMERINGLVEPEYRFGAERESGAAEGVKRFL